MTQPCHGDTANTYYENDYTSPTMIRYDNDTTIKSVTVTTVTLVQTVSNSRHPNDEDRLLRARPAASEFAAGSADRAAGTTTSSSTASRVTPAPTVPSTATRCRLRATARFPDHAAMTAKACQ